MSQNILKLPDFPVPKARYLFDANIWLYILLDGDPRELGSKQKYVDFFSKFKNISPPAKVLLPAIVLSEVINRLLRDVYFEIFQEKNFQLFTSGVKKQDFKNVYRPNEQYEIDLNSILYNIKSYHNFIEFVSDRLEEETAKTLLRPVPSGLDFNDFLIVKLANKYEAIIVTNDADFKNSNAKIIYTVNGNLLN